MYDDVEGVINKTSENLPAREDMISFHSMWTINDHWKITTKDQMHKLVHKWWGAKKVWW